MTAQIAAETPALLALLRKRLAAGDTITEAARALGVSPHRARGIIVRHGREPGQGKPRAPRPKPQASKPPPVVVAPPPVVAPELPGPQPGCCAWPEGEGREIRFDCRSPPQPGRPYCAEHVRRAFIRPPARTGVPLVFQRLGTGL